MHRIWWWTLGLIGAATVAGIGFAILGANPERSGQPALARGCHKVLVRDAASGTIVRGIEDIAIDERTATAYLAADDRRAVEQALAENRGEVPQGGIYALDLDKVTADTREVAVNDATAAFKLGNSFHPHGIDLVVTPGERPTLFAVNRRQGDRWPGKVAATGADATIEVFDVVDSHPARLVHRHSVQSHLLCRANDVAGLARDRFLVSIDGSACAGPARWLELGLGLARGAVMLGFVGDASKGAEENDTIVPVAENIDFANGIALDDRRVFLAATRGRVLLVYARDGVVGVRGPLEPERVIPLAAAPDNLSWAPDGRLLVAVHPSLLKLARYRYGWLDPGSAPSEIIDVDVSDDGRRLLHRDEQGRVLSAASVAVVHDDLLLVGSVVDDGLMVCRYPGEPAAGRPES